MDNEFGYGMKYYNDNDPALLRLEALKEAQDLWYETQDWREEANLNNADDEEMEDFIFEHAREKIHDLTPNEVRIFLYTKKGGLPPFSFPRKVCEKNHKKFRRSSPEDYERFHKKFRRTSSKKYFS